MPTRTWTGATNNNWTTATNWSEGFVPTNADDVIFSTNVNCSVTSAAVCKTINFGTYSGTFVNTAGLTVSGNVTLGASVVWGTFTTSLVVNATSTLTSNGKDIPRLQFSNTITVTLADNWDVSSILTFVNAAITVTLNGSILYVSGTSISHGNGCTVNGTTAIHITGTTSWAAGAAYISNPITINTVGTFTLSNNFYLNGNIVTWISGTMASIGSTTALTGNVTFTGTGLNFGNITALNNTVLTLSNDITMSGTLLGDGSAVTFAINGFNLYVGGGLNTKVNTMVSGTTNIILNGTGTIQNTSSTGNFRINIEINTLGTITIGTTLRFNLNTFTYTAGTVITTGSTMSISSNCTLATDGIIWNNITTTTGLTTLTLTNKLTVSGELWFQGDTTISGDVFETYGLMIGQITAANSIDLLLVASKEYIVTGYIRHYGARQGGVGTIKSASPGTKTLLTVRQGSTQNIGYVDVTDVNSLNGITLRSYSGSFSNTDNWIRLNQEYTIGNGS